MMAQLLLFFSEMCNYKNEDSALLKLDHTALIEIRIL